MSSDLGFDPDAQRRDWERDVLERADAEDRAKGVVVSGVSGALSLPEAVEVLVGFRRLNVGEGTEIDNALGVLLAAVDVGNTQPE